MLQPKSRYATKRAKEWSSGSTGEQRRLFGGKRRRESLFLPLCSFLRVWRLLAVPYLLLIRYEAVSRTPVMGLEMVALRSCEARDMIYPHIDTHIQMCVPVCLPN